jgi:hypothetical protein
MIHRGIVPALTPLGVVVKLLVSPEYEEVASGTYRGTSGNSSVVKG